VAALLGATFVGTINNSIANVAVPSIADDLSVDLTVAVWVITAFVLPLGILMPLAGRMGDMFGARRVFLIGTVTFALASLIVASGDHIAVIVAGRLLQGASGAPVLPCILATISRLFGPHERAKAVALWAGVNAGALAAGPAVGGVIVDGWGWRAIFFLSAPAILVVGVLVALLVPPDLPTVRRRIDWLGAGLIAAVLTAFVVPVTEATSWGLLAPRTLGLVGVSGVLVLVLVRHLHRTEEPFLDPALLRRPGLLPLTMIASVQMVALFSITFAVPVFYVIGTGAGASSAGLLTAALPASMLAGAILAGRLGDRVPLPTMFQAGGLAMLIGVGLIAAAAPNRLGVVAGLVIVGGGVSLIQSPAAAAVTVLAPPDQTGIAAGIFNTARFVLGGLGATLAAVLFDVGSGREHGDDAVPLAEAVAGLRLALLLGAAASAVILVSARRHRAVVLRPAPGNMPIVNSSQT
jgi:MFS family permease